jgi:hypothetical protein
MSAGDYISLRRARVLNGVFSARDAGLNTVRARLNSARRTVVTDKYDDVVPNKWFGIKDPGTECATCSLITGPEGPDECTPETKPAIPHITVKDYSTIKTDCTFVIYEVNNIIIRLTVTSIEVSYDSVTGNVVFIYEV